MSSNSIGTSFVVTSFGESHGKCAGIMIDGCPAGLPLNEQDIQTELVKRKPGISRIATSRLEQDSPEILSGVFNGYTTGAPINIVVANQDVDSSPYEAIRLTPRPGHADYPVSVRYGGFNDYRGSGRFSGRITVGFMMAGIVAKKLLKRIGVQVLAHTLQIGSVTVTKRIEVQDVINHVYQNPVRCADPEIARQMEQEILTVKKEGDSLGGIVECIAINYPPGLGNPVFDTLDGDIAKIIFSIPAVKGIEFGAGFRVSSLKGSENNDAYVIQNHKIKTKTNNCGGILGGLSNGMPIVLRIAIKPTSSIFKKQQTINLKTKQATTLELSGRHDPCIVPRAIPVIESCVAIVLVDHAIRLGQIPAILDSI